MSAYQDPTRYFVMAPTNGILRHMPKREAKPREIAHSLLKAVKGDKVSKKAKAAREPLPRPSLLKKSPSKKA